jgi:hypothetical protein
MKTNRRVPRCGVLSCLALLLTPGLSIIAAESIFPDTVTPASRPNDAPNWELGTIFHTELPGKITQVRVFSLADELGDHEVRIWRNADGSLIAGPIPWTYGGDEAWITLDIPDVPIESDQDYTIAISTTPDGWYPANGSYFLSAGNNGQNLDYPQAAGVFSTTAGARPTDSFNNAAYLRDIVFETDLSGTVMKVKGNNFGIANGATNVSAANGTDVGTRGVNSGTRDQVYTIYNPGQSDLHLTGSPLVALSGAQAGDFVVTAPPAALVPAGGSTPFTVRFDPSAVGARKAVVSIAHADNPANPYSFVIQGTGLGGGAGVIGNDGVGAFARNIDDAQIHGNRFVSPVDMRITELHAKVLALTGTFKCAVYSDTNGVADRLLQSSTDVVNATNGWNTFPLVAPLNLTGGESYWLVVWADTAGARVQADIFGTYSSGPYSYVDLGGQWPDPITLTQAPGDAAVRTYCIYAEGTPIGTVPGPEIDLRGEGKLIVSGDPTPSSLDGTDFGNIGVAGSFQDQTFTIQNPGDAPLSLAASPPVRITGPAAGDFVVTTPPPATVPAGGTASFTIRFDPATTGLRAATVSVGNDDPDENPYQFAVQGAGFAAGRESIFSDSKTGKNIDFDGSYYELGTQFSASVPGTITQLRVYALASEAGDHTARIWRDSDESVIGGPYVWKYGGTNGWIELDIPAVPIDANTEYTVSVSTGTSPKKNYPNVAADLLVAGSNGQHLSYPVNAGVFTTTKDARPTGSFNGGNYLRDIVFTPAGVPAQSVHITEVKTDLTSGNLTLRWEGDGAPFQVLKATKVTGPYQNLGAPVTAHEFTDLGALKGGGPAFYQVSH